MTPPPDGSHHYPRFVILCAASDIQIAEDLLFALRFSGYHAALPPVDVDDGRTVALAFWSDGTRSDESALSLFRHSADAAEIMHTIVVRLCDAPLPFFARGLPTVDGR